MIANHRKPHQSGLDDGIAPCCAGAGYDGPCLRRVYAKYRSVELRARHVGLGEA
jgi:hypothetical protein